MVKKMMFLMDKVARKYLNYRNNFSYIFSKNGELVLMKKLKKLDIKTIFDVGANTGEWAVIAEEVFPQASIHCFEISKTNCEKFKNKSFSNLVKLNDFGLSDISGMISYHDFGSGSTVNTIVESANFFKGSDVILGRVETGDSYMVSNSLSIVDFLKIDVEGAEHMVLSGFKESLMLGQIRIIQFEYGFVNGDAHFLMKDFYRMFEKYGYIVGKLRKNYVEFQEFNYQLNDFYSGPNFVAVKSSDQEIISILSNQLRS
jgi:FkbM family methyltransferase